MTDSAAPFRLRAAGLPDGALPVTRFTGTEGVSTLFDFTVEMVSDEPDLDGERLLCQPATLELGPSTWSGPRRFHGVLSSFASAGLAADGRYLYAATLRPRLWLLTRNRSNRIFATESPMTAVEILRAVLQDDLGLVATDFELRLTGDYPALEHVVQYAETDFAFLSRLLEHWGMAYFFEHKGPSDVLIVTDGNVGFFTIATLDAYKEPGNPTAQGSDPVVRFHPGAGMAAADDPAIQAMTWRHRPRTRQVALSDYNYRLPHVALQARSPEIERGFGTVSDYGDHFKLPEEGALLARIRLEEANCRSTVVSGTSNVKAFRAGFLFDFDNHPQDRCNGRFLLFRIRHEGEAKIAGVSATGETATGYRNTFEAIPGDVPFRPERVTARPRIDGVMHAFVDGAGDGERAEIDEQGRYKVALPFDVAGKPAAQASRWCRMAQPYGGAGHGMHFPLLKGTEVLLIFLDGDPDRPIVSGVVPNPQHPSVVTSRNANRNVLRSVSGVELEFNDGRRGSGGPHRAAASALAGQRHAESPTAGTSRLAAQRQAEEEEEGTSDFSEETGDEKWAKITVPAYEEENTSYLRLGSPDGTWETSAHLPGLADFATYDEEKEEAGWLDYTDGGRFSYTGGNAEILIEGELVQTVVLSGEAVSHWGVRQGLFGTHEYEVGFVSKSEYSWGDKEEYFLGYTFECKAALSFEVTVGFALELTYVSQAAVNLGTKTELNRQTVFEYNSQEHYSVSAEKELFAAEKIYLSVDGAAKSAADVPFEKNNIALGVVSALSFGGLAGLMAMDPKEKGWGAADHILSGAGMGVAIGALAVSSVVAKTAMQKAHKVAHAVNASAPFIKIEEDEITIQVGDSSIVLSDSGIKMSCKTDTVFSLEDKAINLKWQTDNLISLTDQKVKVTGPNVSLFSTGPISLNASNPMTFKINDDTKLQIANASTTVSGANNFGN